MHTFNLFAFRMYGCRSPSVDLLKSSRHVVDSIVDEESIGNLLLISSTTAPLLLGTESLPADWAGGVPVMTWVSM